MLQVIFLMGLPWLAVAISLLEKISEWAELSGVISRCQGAYQTQFSRQKTSLGDGVCREWVWEAGCWTHGRLQSRMHKPLGAPRATWQAEMLPPGLLLPGMFCVIGAWSFWEQRGNCFSYQVILWIFLWALCGTAGLHCTMQSTRSGCCLMETDPRKTHGSASSSACWPESQGNYFLTISNEEIWKQVHLHSIQFWGELFFWSKN